MGKKTCYSCMVDSSIEKITCNLCDHSNCVDCVEEYMLPQGGNSKIKDSKFFLCSNCEMQFPDWLYKFMQGIVSLVAERMDHKTKFVRNLIAACGKKTIVVYRRPNGFFEIGTFTTPKEAKHYITRQKQHHEDNIIVFVALPNMLVEVNKKLYDMSHCVTGKTGFKCPQCLNTSQMNPCTWCTMCASCCSCQVEYAS